MDWYLPKNKWKIIFDYHNFTVCCRNCNNIKLKENYADKLGKYTFFGNKTSNSWFWSPFSAKYGEFLPEKQYLNIYCGS